ncbi:MAG: hypothetical protein KF812_04585 [Fimbriimonadaceae bacterium]|nr:hypothetical protein [Fimbriimonadaceae bacterium]
MSVLIWNRRASGPNLLRDTDTAAILQAIRDANDPGKWFRGDWPLFNHFYRPISTLTFEWDYSRAGLNPVAFGETNALLVMLCVWGLYWFVRELTGRAWQAGIAASLFGIWHLAIDLRPVASIAYAFAILSLLMVFRGGGKFRVAVAICSFGAWWLVATWALPTYDLFFRMIAWVPGRTASTMTVCGLIALAAYARFERTMSPRREVMTTPEDAPVTQSTSGTQVRCWKRGTVWLVVSFVGILAALGSYEQAVTLPALFVGIAVWFALVEKRKPHWWVPLFSWVILFLYWRLRVGILPQDVSRYQEQQFRSGPGVMISIWDYAFPAVNAWRPLWSAIETDIITLLFSETWGFIGTVVGLSLAVIAVIQSRDRWSVAFAWLAALVAFLPMAWLKHFDHYHQWPLAFRALGFTLMIGVAAQALLIAVSPLAQQAPQRSHPAPGSLPRP